VLVPAGGSGSFASAALNVILLFLLWALIQAILALSWAPLTIFFACSGIIFVTCGQ
jgi:hypothetical protein